MTPPLTPTPLTASRVCIIAPEFIGPFPNGGVGTACFWEASTLAAAGLDVTVLYSGPTDRRTPADWEETYRSGPFRYVDLWRWAADGEASAVERVEHPCAEARTSELVFRYLRTERFDLLLFQEFLGHGARTLQARRSGEALADVPAAVTLHSCRQWIYDGMQRLPSSPNDLYVDFLERESARLADYVLAPSRHMAEWAAAHWRLPSPVAVVPYCYDGAHERPARVVEHRGPFNQIVFFGRLETRKGLHLFCRALASSGAARGPVRKVTFLGKRSTVEGRPSDEFIRRTLADGPPIEIEIIDTLGSIEALDWLERQQDTLVVAPSLVDNLPYAVIELFTRQIPFISTRIGGIPEIVGARNAHLLSEPTVQGLAQVLGRAHREGVVMDYTDGYSSAAATQAHLESVRMMLRHRPVERVEGTEACDIVFVDAVDAASDTRAAAARFGASDPTAHGASFMTLEEWHRSNSARPSIFTLVSTTPCAGMVRRMMKALQDSRVDAVTSYYIARTPEGCHERAPLGASLETGWTRNVFGGPCLAARASTFGVIRQASQHGFSFWRVSAAVACTAHELALVPDVLYESTDASGDEHPETAQAVLGEYAHAGDKLDLGWVLKYARGRASHPGTGLGTAGGRALYDHLLAIPEPQLEALSGLSLSGRDDPFINDLRRVRRRLAELVERWRTSAPRVMIYGAGEHTRLVLSLEPEIGRFVGGFIDRRPISQFLGRACIRPEEFSPATADVILYSSREFERDMYARLASQPVEHALLYSESPAAERPTTGTRVRARLGHESAATDFLRAMYRPPSWATGFISGGDAEFLMELVTGVDPGLTLELGVASGTSSAALLFALDQLRTPARPRRLHSCDVRPTCYFDASRSTGQAVSEMYPAHRATWTLDTAADARRVSQSLAPGSVDLTFIDANHSHPWPLLDLLHLTRVARPESWIALHDIELPTLNPAYQVYGPNWLFEAWPFNKVHGVDASANIGAVQLPADLSTLVPMALALLDRPWEHAPAAWDVEVPDMFREVKAALTRRLQTAAPVGA